MARVRSNESQVEAPIGAVGGKPLLYFAPGDDATRAPALAGVASPGDGGAGAQAVVAAVGEGDPDRVEFAVVVGAARPATKLALSAAQDLGDSLALLRLHADKPLADCSAWDEVSEFPPPGINPPMVYKVRAALDEAGHRHVRIAVSGTFDAARIRRFEGVHAPVDAYCVDQALLSDVEEAAA